MRTPTPESDVGGFPKNTHTGCEPKDEYDRMDVMNELVHITAFYRFFAMSEEEVSDLRDCLHAFGASYHLRGLVLVATEGINGTVSGNAANIRELKAFIEKIAPGTEFKDSTADESPFKRWFVKIRPEIVGLGKPEFAPTDKHHHIDVEEWNRMIEEEDVVVLDTRNDYEVAIGKFKGAIDPQLQSFDQFPDYVKRCGIPKDKKVLMYCTGGIRCEKALLEMEAQGYENVFQLDGGILKYLERSPYKHFEGECFVFDHRTAVDQSLKPSTVYGLCPHTGDPAPHEIACSHCGKSTKVSDPCLKEATLRTCSKNCAEMVRRTLCRASASRG